MNKNQITLTATLSFATICNILPAARYSDQDCAPAPPTACNPDECCRTYCLGPENYGVNAAVYPRTCNGDWVITIVGFYWNAHQDGMEYAVDTKVKPSTGVNSTPRVNLVDAEYLNPEFNWEFGFKVGLGYNTTCDGWDIGILWTSYHGKASSHVEAEADDNHTLLPIWTNFNEDNAENPDSSSLPWWATDIETFWNLNLDLVDFELGRAFWNSKRLSIRPLLGLRYARIRQKYELEHKGGTWSGIDFTVAKVQNNKVDIDNVFKGIGIRAGLDSIWNVGCGWAIYGNTAFSILYGRFHVDQDEMNRDAASPFTKNKFFETKDTFHSSRYIADLILGIQWSSQFCDCKYGFTTKLGWENHIFFDQNQMWRVTRTFGKPNLSQADSKIFLNNFKQRRGNLSTQGWTLTFVFDF